MLGDVGRSWELQSLLLFVTLPFECRTKGYVTGAVVCSSARD